MTRQLIEMERNALQTVKLNQIHDRRGNKIVTGTQKSNNMLFKNQHVKEETLQGKLENTWRQMKT